MGSPVPPFTDALPRLILFEDDHLLVIAKPAGWNTHAPSPYANEGVYDFLRHREPRWASLAIMHRLDKETSGVLVFTKTPEANKSLTLQFTGREVSKSYLLLTEQSPKEKDFSVKSDLIRLGERYGSRPGGQPAETHFTVLGTVARRGAGGRPFTVVRAEPLTGRTHQIRVHASERGFPIWGDTLYGGAPAARVFLHAAELSFRHPKSGETLEFRSPAPWDKANEFPGGDDPDSAATPAFVDPALTDGYRVIHGASHDWPGCFVDRLGEYLLAQSEEPLTRSQQATLSAAVGGGTERGAAAVVRGVYHKLLLRRIRGTAPQSVSPVLIHGDAAPERFVLRENGLKFELSFQEGYSVGIFLDQRDNRRRCLTGHVAAGFDLGARQPSGAKPELLNTFAYTCAFSVAAAAGGWRTTSLDLSKKYLEWGKRNFVLNGLDPAEHDSVFGDTFDWFRRWAKKGRQFDAVILDPPTFSESKEHGRFQAEKDYGDLVTGALGVLAPRGVILASTNAARLEPEKFVETVLAAVQRSGRKVERHHYVAQPPDFPITREEPGYLKTLWVRTA
ncbi:MAG: class I SAM-dependent methyltransferase [Verrucomicrobiales bacterium]|nr:class I SAM-dependent methyltransferase [Verrucomicrobiales bacterium]